MKMRVLKHYFAAVCSAVVIAVGSGCSGGGYPLSVDIELTLGEGYEVNDYGLADAGDVLTPNMAIPPVAVCTLPDRAAVEEMMREAVGSFIAGVIELERLELLEVNIEAASGDFNSLMYLSMYYRPKAVLGVEQPVVELGETASATGLGSSITLTPEESVDVLELIDELEANPAPECPTFGVRLGGVVPEETPVWDVRLKVRVIGHVNV